jgi:hypothetical protein
MIFEVQELIANPGDAAEYREYMVYAIEPKAGGDSALIATFESRIAANELASVLNWTARAKDFFTIEK